MLEGLEITVLLKSEVIAGAETLRYDSDYYLKKYIKQEILVKNNLSSFSKFAELDLKVDSSAFYPALEPFYNMGAYPFIRVGDVKKYVDFEGCVKVPFEILDKYPTLKHVKKGDIVLTKGGTIGLAGLITQNACVTRDLIFINSSELAEADYITLFLFLSSNFAYQQLIRSSSQSVQPHLTTTLVRNLDVFNYSKNFKENVSVLYNLSTQKLELSKQKYQEAEHLLLSTLGLSDFSVSSESVNIKSFKESFGATGRLDAEYYQKKYERFENCITNNSNGYTFIKNEYEHITTLSKKDKLSYNYIEIGDVNVSDGSATYNEVLTSELPANAKTEVKKGDLLVSNVRPYRGAVTVIDFEQENLIVSGAFTVLREKPESIFSNEVLKVLLRTTIYKEWLLKFNVGTSYPVIKDADVLDLPIPFISKEKQTFITERIKESQKLKIESERLLAVSKQAVELAIESGESAAMEYLSSNIT